MKTNQWIRLGLFALATTVALPAVAQRKRPAKGKVTKVTITQPKAGNYVPLHLTKLSAVLIKC